MMSMRGQVDYIATTTKISSIKTIKDQVKRNGKDLRIFRSRIIRLLGNFYLKEMKGEELRKAWRRAFIEVPQEIHTE
jgi:hypothetical protein